MGLIRTLPAKCRRNIFLGWNSSHIPLLFYCISHSETYPGRIKRIKSSPSQPLYHATLGDRRLKRNSNKRIKTFFSLFLFICTFTHTHTHTHRDTLKRIYTHTSACTYAHICSCICTFISAYAPIWLCRFTGNTHKCFWGLVSLKSAFLLLFFISWTVIKKWRKSLVFLSLKRIHYISK